MSTLMERLKDNTTIKDSSILENSKFFEKKDMITTSIPALNIALSGKLHGGLTPGLTMWAAPSKHFKSAFSLLLAKAYMDKYPESIVLFYDSEFGTPSQYFSSFKIDKSRVLHTPITDIEQLKFDCMTQLEQIKRGDKIIIIIDSIGNLASKKEVEDALEQKSAADMTRAKQIKSLFRMITPHLTIKDIPMVVINHTYKEIGLYPKDIVGGGTGSYYSSDNIFMVSRQQEKDGKDISGYNFIINVEKSRFVKEKSKIPITVSFEGGISKWSGLLDIALESGHVIKPKNGWYQKVDMETGEVFEKNYREADTNNVDFWFSIISSKSFNKFVEQKYCIAQGDIVKEDTEEIYKNLEQDSEE
mgnify:CR=1 FL=1